MKSPSIKIALLPLLFLIITLAVNVYVFGDNATGGPNQLALIMAALFAAVLAVFLNKVSYEELEISALSSIDTSMKACLILAVVGILIASWIIGGVVPAMIYYGVKLIHPNLFLPLACIISALVSTSTGSSWSTAGTIGVALMGIGVALGLPAPVVAGSIISGAYFGDKMSPLSDTTNLAPTIAGTDLFTHIRKMLGTTVPSIIVSLIIFTLIGLFSAFQVSNENQGLEQFLQSIDTIFTINPILLLAPVFVGIMVAKKVPTLPALLGGVILGVFFSLIFQGELIGKSPYRFILSTLYNGVALDMGGQKINALLQQGGLTSMFNTIALIVSAMIFGGIMKGAGYLECIASYILKLCTSIFRLISMTIGSGLLLNMTASDQYLSIVVTGEVFRDSYQKRKLPPELLSRSIEDGATVTSVLIPWNTCGAYFATVLGVSTLEYLPYCFFNMFCPIISIILGAKLSKSFASSQG